ncbi:hypothetical protein F52700_5145 [Fusarium sp. NRRL 52700]|nr:hypothetical protein F52700_5145 [Fusarium sp. NRRL 52700]
MQSVLSPSSTSNGRPFPDKEPARRHPLRSRAGCWTCREKKVKCDETRPQCRRCVRLHRSCDYESRARKPYTRGNQGSPQEQPLPRRQPQRSSGDGETPGNAVHPTAAERTAPDSPGSTHDTTHQFSPIRPPEVSPLQASQSNTPVAEPSNSETLPSDVVFDPVSEVSAACAEILEASDTEAIHCFRFVLAPSIDRKQPETTVLATMWKLAIHSPMVLHMICALGAQQSYILDRQKCELDASMEHARTVRAAEHYGASLRLLVIAAAEDTGQIGELDLILATLWLMLEYEQRFGDGSGSGLSAHLKGAGSILQGRIHKLRDMIEDDDSHIWSPTQEYGLQSSAVERKNWTISDFASRIVVWISYKDGAAALNGFGGFFNELLGEVLADPNEDYAQSLIRGFDALQKRANRAYSDNFDHQLPHELLLEDVHSRPLFYLYGNTGQIKFLLSRLVALKESDELAFEDSRRQVARLLNATTDRYAEFLDIAHTLHVVPSGPHRTFVVNIRIICAHYHAAVLCYFRIVRGDAPLDSRQRAALSRILNIGHQTYAGEGEAVMTALAWPLFVTALETDDALHRTWIMERYETMCEQGENYRRAHAALRAAFSMQRYHERRVDLLELLRNTSRHNRFLI